MNGRLRDICRAIVRFIATGLLGAFGTPAPGGSDNRAHHTSKKASLRSDENRKLCETLVRVLEDAIKARGAVAVRDSLPREPGSAATSSPGRDLLPEIQFYCPPRVFFAALGLVEAFEAWEGGRARLADYQVIRSTFLELVREQTA